MDLDLYFLIMEIEKIAVFAPSHIVVYKDFSKLPKRTQDNKNSLNNLIQNKGYTYNGYMSPPTGRKVRKMINCLLLTLSTKRTHNARRPTFVTLTLPAKQQHDDNFIKRNLLNNFIKYAREKWNVKYYIWRAEPQGNGNIHFHIIFDNRICWKKIRAKWNIYLHINGYIQQYRTNQQTFHKNGFTLNTIITNNPNRKQQYKNYIRKAKRAGTTIETFINWDERLQREAYNYGVKTNWSNPNTTDIHGLRGIRNVSAYITKYMTKDDTKHINKLQELKEKIQKTAIGEQERTAAATELNKLQTRYRTIKGRIWGASDSLRELKYYSDTASVENFDYSIPNHEIENYLYTLRNDSKVKYKSDNNFELYLLDTSQRHKMQQTAPSLFYKYDKYYRTMYKTLY